MAAFDLVAELVELTGVDRVDLAHLNRAGRSGHLPLDEELSPAVRSDDAVPEQWRGRSGPSGRTPS